MPVEHEILAVPTLEVIESATTAMAWSRRSWVSGFVVHGSVSALHRADQLQ
jgi:hypothetical protein